MHQQHQFHFLNLDSIQTRSQVFCLHVKVPLHFKPAATPCSWKRGQDLHQLQCAQQAQVTLQCQQREKFSEKESGGRGHFECLEFPYI